MQKSPFSEWNQPERNAKICVSQRAESPQCYSPAWRARYNQRSLLPVCRTGTNRLNKMKPPTQQSTVSDPRRRPIRKIISKMVKNKGEPSRTNRNQVPNFSFGRTSYCCRSSAGSHFNLWKPWPLQEARISGGCNQM
jgi:hypothetical protein